MNLTKSMLMWIILGFGWLGVLFAAVSLFRVAGYADKKVRSIAQRSRRQNDRAA
jgi:type IV secretory pathway TrbD component